MDRATPSPAAEAPAGTLPEPGWRTLLAGSPREVLARLVQDDPLGIRARVAARLRADALLLDADRVHLRALARISRFAGAYRGRPDLAEWIESAVLEAIDELVREEHEIARSRAVRERAPPTRPGSIDEPEGPEAFVVLAAPLGLDPMAMRTACVAFDALPWTDRSAFFALVLDGRSLDETAKSAGASASEVARRARRALDVILAAALPSEATAEVPGRNP